MFPPKEASFYARLHARHALALARAGGHYRTEAEAQTVAEKIERYYPNALKVRSQILVPRED